MSLKMQEKEGPNLVFPASSYRQFMQNQVNVDHCLGTLCQSIDVSRKIPVFFCVLWIRCSLTHPKELPNSHAPG